MLLLALDTSGGLGAAVTDGREVLAARADADPRAHAERLSPAVRDVLARAGVDRRQLTGVAVGVGPAPFTGLRVGVVTALVLGEALGVPVHGVCSLDALAASARGVGVDGPLVVAADAKRREVHWAAYDAAQDPLDVRRAQGPAVGPLADARAAAERVGAALVGPLDVAVDPGALALLAARRLGAGGELLAPEPLYLRRPDAVEPRAGTG